MLDRRREMPSLDDDESKKGKKQEAPKRRQKKVNSDEISEAFEDGATQNPSSKEKAGSKQSKEKIILTNGATDIEVDKSDKTKMKELKDAGFVEKGSTKSKEEKVSEASVKKLKESVKKVDKKKTVSEPEISISRKILIQNNIPEKLVKKMSDEEIQERLNEIFSGKGKGKEPQKDIGKVKNQKKEKITPAAKEKAAPKTIEDKLKKVKNMKKDIEGELKNPPQPENTASNKKVESKVELTPPKVEDIDFYNLRIEKANKDIEAWEKTRDKALSAGKKPEAEKLQTRIDIERDAAKVMEDKLQKAEILKKEAIGKVEGRGKDKAKKYSPFEEFKKDSISKEDRKRIEAMMTERYKGRGLTIEQINDIRKKTPTRWENEVKSHLKVEQKGKRETTGDKKGAYEKLMEDKNKMYDRAVEGQKQKEAVEREKRIEDLLAQIKAVKEDLVGKHVNKFEEFEESIKGDKYDHEKIKNAYLQKLGWKVKYDAFNSKAWLSDGEGNFIDKNGVATKNKKDKVEFKTQWRFPTETPFIKFLREQVKKKLGGIESQVESKPSPEEEKLKKWKEAFPLESEAQEIIEEANKKAWYKIHGPSGMAEAWEAMEESQEKKPKSFWQKFKEFWTKER